MKPVILPVARPAFIVPAVLAIHAATLVAAAQSQPIYRTQLVDVDTPGHAVAIEAAIPPGTKKLFLVATDGGNGYAADWAVWVDPVVRGTFGEKRLAELKWVRAATDWGAVNIDRNSEGGPLRVAGQAVRGISAHAVSIIEYDLPDGTNAFAARGALDEGGSSQGGASVHFALYTERPRLAPGDRRGGSREPEDALDGLTVADGLEAVLFAHEPMVLSPSAIDVDARGRVWVAEIVNYRGHNGKRPEGDRILILEDTDGDGKADDARVFFQSREIDSPHGVCVLGNTVLVSASGVIHRLIDTDGDDRADVHEKLFTGVGGPQHDHGVHQVMFGPDGRLYFNVGNDGGLIRDRDGNPITDLAGNVIEPHRKPYQQGLVFRCEPDGSRVETLGWNFRNNWEVTVDSFGTLWQSDNDDDGNRAVRINFVMEFGNYGFRDEFTGAGWGEERTNWEPDIPSRHWHLNDPGVVPNLLLTGAGSPTGIMVYEGSLLPAAFRNQVIHCDAGPNIVRAYPVELAGAGWSARIENILEGTEDKWFRPSDVVAAPDGSLVVADWYDPGVGGHAMGDLERGRIFRVAPKGAVLQTPKLDLTTPEGAAEALKSPALSTRYLAYTALREFGAQAEPALTALWRDANPRFRARALWLLGQLDAAKYVDAAVADADPDIRVTGLRLARRMQQDVLPVVARLVNDPSAHVRRECAIALRHLTAAEAAGLWAELAVRHDGLDRWYLEALGIAADRQWDSFLDAWLTRLGGEEKVAGSAAARDIVWRSRGGRSARLNAQLVMASETTAGEALRYLRALDFQAEEPRVAALQELAATLDQREGADELMAVVIGKLPAFNAAEAPAGLKAALDRFLAAHDGNDTYFDYVSRFNLRDQTPVLIRHARNSPGQKTGVQAIRQLVAWGELAAVEELLSESGDRAPQVFDALGQTGQRPAIALLEKAVRSDNAAWRVPAVTALGRSRGGEQALLAMAKGGHLPDEPAQVEAARVLGASRDESIRHQATQALATLVKIPEGVALPPISEMATRQGDATAGHAVFALLCANCHQVGSEGIAFGPALTGIGAKLPKEGLLASIIDPNQGISFGYEGWVVETRDGTTLAGLITSETDNALTLRAVGGLDTRIRKSNITKREKMTVSLMTPLAPAVTEQQLVDLVEYLAGLKN